MPSINWTTHKVIATQITQETSTQTEITQGCTQYKLLCLELKHRDISWCSRSIRWSWNIILQNRINFYRNSWSWIWHRARLPSVCEVRIRVEPTLTHKMGTCLRGDMTLELLEMPPCGTAVSLHLETEPVSELSQGLIETRQFPEEESHTRTIPFILPVTSVSRPYSCRCKLFITLLSCSFCHRIACFLRTKEKIFFRAATQVRNCKYTSCKFRYALYQHRTDSKRQYSLVDYPNIMNDTNQLTYFSNSLEMTELYRIGHWYYA